MLLCGPDDDQQLSSTSNEPTHDFLSRFTMTHYVVVLTDIGMYMPPNP
jgi:hypothetical protein